MQIRVALKRTFNYFLTNPVQSSPIYAPMRWYRNFMLIMKGSMQQNMHNQSGKIKSI